MRAPRIRLFRGLAEPPRRDEHHVGGGAQVWARGRGPLLIAAEARARVGQSPVRSSNRSVRRASNPTGVAIANTYQRDASSGILPRGRAAGATRRTGPRDSEHVVG